MTQRDKIIKDLEAELQYSTEKWGTDFDNLNTSNDWVAYITSYAGRGVTYPWNEEDFRSSMLKVAGLAISAIERIDDEGVAKRHYDE